MAEIHVKKCNRFGFSGWTAVRGSGAWRVRLAPLQEILIGVIPASCRVGRLLKLETDVPLTFHGMLPAEKFQQEHSLICGDEIDKDGDISAV